MMSPTSSWPLILALSKNSGSFNDDTIKQFYETTNLVACSIYSKAPAPNLTGRQSTIYHMNGVPNLSNFRAYFPKHWFYEHIRDIFEQSVINRPDFVHEDITSFINSNIRNSTVPGFNDQGTPEQIEEQSAQKFQGSLEFLDVVERTVSIEMNLSEDYMNYAMFYLQKIESMNRTGQSKNKSPFMPEIFVDVIDYEGNVILGLKFFQTFIQRLTTLNLSITDSDIEASKTFTIDLWFNGMEVNYNKGILENIYKSGNTYVASERKLT